MIAAPAAPGAPALELRGITKRFGALVALDDVSFAVQQGSVHALLGENGAGKSTLVRIAYGLLDADSGVIAFDGRASRPNSVPAAIAAGLGMVHQHLSLAPSLRASENLVLGGRGLLHPQQARQLLREAAQASGLPAPPDLPVKELSVVEQQRLEILKALARKAKVLVLDEPTAVLAPAEADELLNWVRAFADRGGSVVLVTHKLREALAVADAVTILRRGRVTFEGSARGRTESELAQAIFPESIGAPAQPMARPSTTDTVVRASAIHLHDARGVLRMQDASFELRRGEIVGVAAVEGSGHHELLGALAGFLRPSAGALDLPPRIALIPADRAKDAIIADFSITENVALRGLGPRRGLMPWTSLAHRAERLIEAFAIHARSPHNRARELSGGNQQRVVVARELDGDTDLVVADNPTRGLDLRATAFVFEQLRAAATRGTCVVVHSSDVDELLGVATRVLVVFQGRLTAVNLDRDEIGRAMLGASAVGAA